MYPYTSLPKPLFFNYGHGTLGKVRLHRFQGLGCAVCRITVLVPMCPVEALLFGVVSPGCMYLRQRVVWQPASSSRAGQES